MYIRTSRSGSIDSSVMSWAITSLADASSICTPRKMIRSSKSLLYGFISLIPYDVRSTKDGSTYLDCGCITLCSCSWGLGCGDFEGAADHVVDEAILLGLRCRVPAVAVGVLFDLLDRLTGVVGGALEQRLLHVQHLLGLDADVGGRAPDAAGRLVHQDRRVRQRIAL